jgi:hypothetical protein
MHKKINLTQNKFLKLCNSFFLEHAGELLIISLIEENFVTVSSLICYCYQTQRIPINMNVQQCWSIINTMFDSMKAHPTSDLTFGLATQKRRKINKWHDFFWGWMAWILSNPTSFMSCRYISSSCPCHHSFFSLFYCHVSVIVVVPNCRRRFKVCGV